MGGIQQIWVGLSETDSFLCISLLWNRLYAYSQRGSLEMFLENADVQSILNKDGKRVFTPLLTTLSPQPFSACNLILCGITWMKTN